MFTGLIREIAKVSSFENNILTIQSSHKPKLGDSIAINGACLTVIRFDEGSFSVELSAETSSIIASENLKDFVHMEPAMGLNDRLEGHIVQGHIDCIGVIKAIKKNENAVDLHIDFPDEFSKFVVPKGSVAVDGVSLTINEAEGASFRLTIISHTLKNTLFSNYRVGRRVNIETDMFARYIYHMFSKEKSLSWEKVDSIMALY